MVSISKKRLALIVALTSLITGVITLSLGGGDYTNEDPNVRSQKKKMMPDVASGSAASYRTNKNNIPPPRPSSSQRGVSGGIGNLHLLSNLHALNISTVMLGGKVAEEGKNGQIRTRSKSVQEVKMCRVKYPDETMLMLKRTLAARGVRKVAIVGNFKGCAHVLPSIEEAVLQVSDILSPENVFVSFLESGSKRHDQTPNILRSMSDRFQAAGVSNVITTGNNRISAGWKPGHRGNRIDFLARLRNAAMLPAMSIFPEGHFDKVFFVNDVYICGGDILRLLAHEADIACGLDYESAREDVWDAWVLTTWWYPYAKMVRANHPTLNVFSCWNGGMASRAALWYSGIRFRRGMPEMGRQDCSQSECSLWNMDAHTLGYHNVVLDPSIQVGYDWRPYESNFRDSNPHIKESVESPHVSSLNLNLSNISYTCCELEGSNAYVDWGRCHNRTLVTPGKEKCDRNASECLRYTPSRWEEKWDWNSLLKNGHR